jgi:hypothetical protein
VKERCCFFFRLPIMEIKFAMLEASIGVERSSVVVVGGASVV